MNQFYLVVLLAFIILIVYSIAGFYGIGLCALGLLCTPVTLLSINFLAGISSDAYKFTKTAKTYGVIIDRIYKMAWASRNYSIYL